MSSPDASFGVDEDITVPMPPSSRRASDPPPPVVLEPVPIAHEVGPSNRFRLISVLRTLPWHRIGLGAAAVLPALLLLVFTTMARNPAERPAVAAAPPARAVLPVPTFVQQVTPPAVSASADDGTPRTGDLVMPKSAHRAWVDGVPHRLDGRALVLSCGPHTIKLPGRAPRRVTIPCGGTATL